MNTAKQQHQQRRRDNKVIAMNEQFAWGADKAPKSIEAEEATIGAILTYPARYHSLATFLQADDFFIVRHRYIWEALANLSRRKEAIDFLTVRAELERMGKLAEIGGPSYLTQLINNTPSAHHAEIYGRLVERAAIRRRLLGASDDIKALAVDESLTLEQVTTRSMQTMAAICGRGVLNRIEPFGASMERYIKSLANATAAYQNHGSLASMGVPSGLRHLDVMLEGFQREAVTITGGATGMGKTSFCLTVALNMVRLGAKVLYVPLERDRKWAINRFLAMETGINRGRIRRAQLSPDEQKQVVEAATRLGKLPLVVYEKPDDPDWHLTPEGLLNVAQASAFEHGLDVIIVDYIGLMGTGGQHAPGSYEEKSYVSRSMSPLAKALNVHVLCAAQLNIRKINQRSIKKRRPELGDLMYVGETDMDTCLFLYRDAVYNPKAADKTMTEIIVAKNREEGRLGTVKAQYTGEKYIDVREPDGYEFDEHWSSDL